VREVNGTYAQDAAINLLSSLLLLALAPVLLNERTQRWLFGSLSPAQSVFSSRRTRQMAAARLLKRRIRSLPPSGH
jgi:hypothetical protein